MTVMHSTLLNEFENFDVNPVEFGHLQHVQVAFEILQKYSYLEASYKYSHAINTIATNAGAPEKFNTTITLAFLSLIAERISRRKDADFNAFLATNADLLDKNLLNNWYSKERLESKNARQLFLLPDRPGVQTK